MLRAVICVHLWLPERPEVESFIQLAMPLPWMRPSLSSSRFDLSDAARYTWSIACRRDDRRSFANDVAEPSRERCGLEMV
ncbi:hypothetical protein SH528x_002429 [Novipirellula sp. SH528]|uniref:hypothetical protein n=1 Tax=Novipirellula sp. SH528 TaxID=3454466 RepID=UPI003F9FFE82